MLRAGTVIGILGAGELGSQLARAAIHSGYRVVLANSREPHTLRGLIGELGPSAQADTAAQAAAAADFAILAFPYAPWTELPAAELAGKVVLDTNNYMPIRDGHFAAVDSGAKTVHEIRQEQLPAAKLAKAFTHIQAPSLFRFARPADAPDRHALTVSSDHPEAVDLVRRLYDEFGFDTVDNSPLRESWRSAPGTPMWHYHHIGQSRAQLIANLRNA